MNMKWKKIKIDNTTKEILLDILKVRLPSADRFDCEVITRCFAVVGKRFVDSESEKWENEWMPSPHDILDELGLADPDSVNLFLPCAEVAIKLWDDFEDHLEREYKE